MDADNDGDTSITRTPARWLRALNDASPRPAYRCQVFTRVPVGADTAIFDDHALPGRFLPAYACRRLPRRLSTAIGSDDAEAARENRMPRRRLLVDFDGRHFPLAAVAARRGEQRALSTISARRRPRERSRSKFAAIRPRRRLRLPRSCSFRILASIHVATVRNACRDRASRSAGEFCNSSFRRRPRMLRERMVLPPHATYFAGFAGRSDILLPCVRKVLASLFPHDDALFVRLPLPHALIMLYQQYMLMGAAFFAAWLRCMPPLENTGYQSWIEIRDAHCSIFLLSEYTDAMAFFIETIFCTGALDYAQNTYLLPLLIFARAQGYKALLRKAPKFFFDTHRHTKPLIYSTFRHTI